MTTGRTAEHHVVVVGSGFGGLQAVVRLKGAPVRITLIDRRNHHLFQPLLYQVATAALTTSEIAWPIRHLLRERHEATTLLADVQGVDTGSREVLLDDDSRVRYDTLILATGARHAYFGHDEWEEDAPGLKTLEDATTLRRRILVAFERAERETDPDARAALLTFVVVGAGPTGVELAGQVAEMAHRAFTSGRYSFSTEQAKIYLLDGAPQVLPPFGKRLGKKAQRQLEPGLDGVVPAALRHGDDRAVGEVARHVLLSQRQLRTLMRAELGIGPKTACRLARFDHALERIVAGRLNKQIADDLGDAHRGSDQTGKDCGKDAGKETFLAVFGTAEALNRCHALLAEADGALHASGIDARPLRRMVGAIFGPMLSLPPDDILQAAE